ncbi:prohibitin family protein [Planctomycetes bacterium K23_9]|uniref:SPFH domain / Band 7 family protein n=1 Tax=Stieleria marina TaxID=1930275 RepID=A0A517P0K5_9BACT|nr:SPFH domain / Band 7 family protein [Planctomycetes bacterium K23_9]
MLMHNENADIEYEYEEVPADGVSGWFRRTRTNFSIVAILIVVLVAAISPLVFKRVEAGEVGVRYWLFGGGTQTDRVYEEGLHIILPCDTLFRYNARVSEIEHNVDLLTSNGLAVKFFLSIRYRPERELAGVLHKTIGPDYVEAIVLPEVTSVMRRNIGRMTAEDLYTTKHAVLETMFSEAIEKLAQSYVIVDFIGIRTIELPPQVKDSIEEKIRQQHIAAAYEYRLLQAQKEAQRLEIEAGGIKNFNETIAESITEDVLRWKGVQATSEIATSSNSKVVVIGNGDQGLPVILGAGK